MDSVYIETTVIGNIAGRLHPESSIADRQIITRKWWATAPEHYQLFISQITVDECSDGDATAANERLTLLTDIRLLDPSEQAERLAELFVARLAVPATEPRDDSHIAIAAVNRIQFIVTWNFKHILNPHLQIKFANPCREAGFDLPVICTPQQLLETGNDS